MTDDELLPQQDDDDRDRAMTREQARAEILYWVLFSALPIGMFLRIAHSQDGWRGFGLLLMGVLVNGPFWLHLSTRRS